MSADDRSADLGRRQFLALAGAAGILPGWQSGCKRATVPDGPESEPTTIGPGTADIGPRVRLILGDRASQIERTCSADAADLLARSLGRPVPVLDEPTVTASRGFSATADKLDVLVTCAASSPRLPPAWASRSTTRGSFRIRVDATPEPGQPAVTIVGADPEGARNGLYRWLEGLGFGFFRDGETIPRLAGQVIRLSPDDREEVPAFRYRGDMIWDFYTGPRRYCAATWGLAEWRRALLFMARRGLDFLEFYPPLETVMSRAFPKAKKLADGRVWNAASKHELAQQVVEEGRALGIEFMYVLTYGQFPAAVQELHADLEWRNGFLCAHQPQLIDFTRATWAALIDELGTDHLYAVRHRGEEGQSYSDPCRSIEKAQGLTQAFDILRGLDPRAVVTVWTWAEKLPDLFANLPRDIRAAHIRHGMGGVFSERPVGREQSDGAPTLPAGQRWLSGQFTVFSGSESGLQTQWCNAAALARDARTAAQDERCEGFFQWPEWSGTSPWVSHVITVLSWNPHRFELESALEAYASSRHGRLAQTFLDGFRPLFSAGNARFVSTPRKRMVNAHALARGEVAVLERVRRGLAAMGQALAGEGATQALFVRDTVDLACWVGGRHIQALEAAAYREFTNADRTALTRDIQAALRCWTALGQLTGAVPDLSLASTARAMAAEAPLSSDPVAWFFERGCDFYHGYPLILSPEAIELAYAPQCQRLGQVLQTALESGQRQPLARPTWFWHDFPDPKWADAVRLVPREDETDFATAMRARLRTAFADGQRQGANGHADPPATARRTAPPWTVAIGPLDKIRSAIDTLLTTQVPTPLSGPPDW